MRFPRYLSVMDNISYKTYIWNKYVHMNAGLTECLVTCSFQLCIRRLLSIFLVSYFGDDTREKQSGRRRPIIAHGFGNMEFYESSKLINPAVIQFSPKKNPPPKDIADKWHDDRLLGRSSGRFSLWKFTQAFSEQFLTLVVVSMRTHNKKKSNFLAVTCRIKIIHLT